MMRSLSTAVSGLRTHQTRMDVLAHNVANVNTVGFKSARVTFSDMFSQNIGSANGANDATGRGGVNPRQIGLGTSVASIDRLMTEGATTTTNNSFDLAIQGQGFFAVSDAEGTFFTRAGALSIDESGNIVTVGGMRVLGWDAVADPNNPGEYMIQRGAVQPLTIGPDKQFSAPEPTTLIEFTRNLSADMNNGVQDSTMSFFDTLGNRFTVDVRFTFIPPEDGEDGFWTFQMGSYAFPNGDRTSPMPLDITIAVVDGQTVKSIGMGAVIDPSDMGDIFIEGGAAHELMFNEAGRLTAGGSLILDIEPNEGSEGAPASEFGNNGIISIDFENLTQFNNDSPTARGDEQDGHSSGELNNISIAGDGQIVGNYTNGQIRILGQIPIAQFANPAGLESVGGNLFMATMNSGLFDGVGVEGNMQAGVLEMSNVDIAQEFTDMIITQRGFQANSRIISTSDDLLQELVNLRR
jgi:flagellar hook protein FlgE